MPNWCDNNLNLYFDTSNKAHVEFIKGLIESIEKKEELLHYLKPMPSHQPDLLKPNPFNRDGLKFAKEMPFEEQKTIEKMFGGNNWYDWSCDNWGTKWEASSIEFNDLNDTLEDIKKADGTSAIYIFFNSAWAPPIQALVKSKLTELGIDYTLEFYESGQGFIGHCINGSINEVEINVPDKVRKNRKKIQKYFETLFESEGINLDLIDHYCLVDNYIEE
jgi:hypothetical protein